MISSFLSDRSPFSPIANGRWRLSALVIASRLHLLSNGSSRINRRNGPAIFFFSSESLFISFVLPFEIFFSSSFLYCRCCCCLFCHHSFLLRLSLAHTLGPKGERNPCVRSIRAHGADISCGRSGVGWANLGERRETSIIKC